MKKLAPLALIAALALTGCVSAEPSAESAPAPTVKPAAEPAETPTPTAKPTPTKAVDKSQAWADDMINLFLNGNSKSSFEEFNKDLPHHYIESWSQPEQGVMSVTVTGAGWSQCKMDELAVTVMSTAGHETPEMKSVVTRSENKNMKGFTDRSGMNFGTPASC